MIYSKDQIHASDWHLIPKIFYSIEGGIGIQCPFSFIDDLFSYDNVPYLKGIILNEGKFLTQY